MHGDHMRHVRQTVFGETQLQFGQRLGFEGPDESVKRRVRRYEKGDTPINGMLAVLIYLLERLGKKKADSARR